MRFRRFPAIVLALVAVALTAVIAGRVAAEPDPPPPDTSPIVIVPSAPVAPSPPRTPRTRGPADERDGGFGRTVPRPRDFDDDADRRPDRLPD